MVLVQYVCVVLCCVLMSGGVFRVGGAGRGRGKPVYTPLHHHPYQLHTIIPSTRLDHEPWKSQDSHTCKNVLPGQTLSFTSHVHVGVGVGVSVYFIYTVSMRVT